MFFEAESSFKAQMYSKVVAWEGKGCMIAALKKAWLAAVEVGVKQKADKATAAAASTPTDDDDKPIDAAIQTSLLERFPQQYKFDIPLELARERLLDRQALAPAQPQQAGANQDRSLANGRRSPCSPGPRKQTVALSKQVKFTVGTHERHEQARSANEQPAPIPLRPADLRLSLAFAGCSEREITRQPRPTRSRTTPRSIPRMVREKQNVVVLQDMYDHLATAQHFVMKWQTHNPPMAQDDILKELTRKDESIRTRWAIAYNSNANKELSLSQVIELCETSSRNRLGTGHHPRRHQAPPGKGGKATTRPQTPARPQRGGGGGGGGGGGRGRWRRRQQPTGKAKAKATAKGKPPAATPKAQPTTTVAA